MGLFKKLGLQDFLNKAEPFHKFNSKDTFDLETLDGINSIPVKQEILKSFHEDDFTNSILYKLQRKATEYKTQGKPELVLACLEKSFYIMINSDYYYGDYADRYVNYLKKYRYFDKAREIEKIIDDRESSNVNTITELEMAIANAKRLGTDLLEADVPKPADAKTAMYRGRIYSISGTDTRFPKLPDDIEDTSIMLYPFLFGISEPNYCKPGEEIERSNRPFKDTRSSKEKKEYEEIVQSCLEEEKNRKDYDWIWENLPDIAPKSLSGYTKMRNSNSSNYKRIVQVASEKGYKI